ncbi:MAG: cobalamin biosynthesis protein CobD [Oscillospiraceae bacterium]|nr:cobalamin biosynthesis protein CobD [Oscillospiraceae bacterium]
MWILCSCAALALGFVLDCIIGDPQWLYHPIRLIGKLITAEEKKIRKKLKNTASAERSGGVLLVINVCIVVFLISSLISVAAYAINKYVYIAVEGIMCYFLLAARSLKTESMKVYKASAKNDVESARQAVSMIVGRDTASLDETGIIKAAVETVAENTSDGVIAPMVFIALGGAPLGFLYKAINTMDSMVGYKNEKYINFGKVAAKLDDIVNFIPARISAILMIGASWIMRMDYRNAVKIWRRDRFNHASPNSAQTEAVCAGALRVQLAGDAYYFGKLYKKKFIGDDLRQIEKEDIKRANSLMYCASVLMLIIIAAIKLVLWRL